MRVLYHLKFPRVSITINNPKQKLSQAKLCLFPFLQLSSFELVSVSILRKEFNSLKLL